jgi:hypothetical protein
MKKSSLNTNEFYFKLRENINRGILIRMFINNAKGCRLHAPLAVTIKATLFLVHWLEIIIAY